MARAQDINIDNKSLWESFISSWQSADYTTALATLSNSALDSKYVGADALNFVTSLLTTVQNTSDPTFKDDLIKIENTAPSTLTTGDVYFQILT